MNFLNWLRKKYYELTGTTELLYLPDIEVVLPPRLPRGLVHLSCQDCKVKVVPKLPNTLERCYLNNNLITRLPKLPKNLWLLDCYDNKLTWLPKLPDKLNTLWISKNKLTCLPTLPMNIKYIDYDSLRIECFIDKNYSICWQQGEDRFNLFRDKVKKINCVKSLVNKF